MRYYPVEAPNLVITNLLDDGVMRMFSQSRNADATRRLGEMIGTVHREYGAELALLCCSAVTREMLEALRPEAPVPVLKIDVPMTEVAVKAGRRIGVLVTFPPTLEITHRLLEDAASLSGKDIELVDELQPDAVDAILAGDAETHDRLLLEAADRLLSLEVDVIVLAQVSMAHLVGPISNRTGLPVFSSLETSLAAVLEELGTEK